MKITRKDLQILIENFLNEDDTGNIKGSSDSSRFNSDPDADDFELTDDMLDPDQSAHEEYVTAVDAYRNPSKPIGNMPNFAFGNEKGVTSRTQGTHIPSSDELDHVRRYQSQEIGGPMPSVDDQEITIPNFDKFDSFQDEDTEESPLGTQYSLEDTEYEDTDFSYDDSSEEEEETGLFSRFKRLFSRK